jgi:hypothetical protein
MDIEKLLENFRYYFSRNYIWRRWMFFTCWRWDNFGSISEFGGIQFLKLKIIPKKSVKTDYILNQYYYTNEIWSVGSYYILFDGRSDDDRRNQSRW